MISHSLDNFLINFSFISILITTLFFWIQFSFGYGSQHPAQKQVLGLFHWGVPTSSKKGAAPGEPREPRSLTPPTSDTLATSPTSDEVSPDEGSGGTSTSAPKATPSVPRLLRPLRQKCRQQAPKFLFFENFWSQVPNFLVIFCSILILLSFINRWITTNHFPLSNLYESLLFLTLAFLVILIYFQFTLKKNFVGVLILPIVLFINTFATFTLPLEMQQPTSLVPALQSNWLMMHVTIMMLSYAALIFGSLLAITFLIVRYILKDKIKNLNITNGGTERLEGQGETTYSTIIENKSSTFRFIRNIDIIYDLDKLSYRVLTFGFPLLTIGILSGSVWANETWGSYWNWDPKETWALITWFVYAIYLHSRIIKGWSGTKPALIASFGFVTVWICYLGVNVFAKGLHSYGWFFTN